MKTKVTSKCLCCSWTNDGQFFAVGHYDGTVTIWTKVSSLIAVTLEQTYGDTRLIAVALEQTNTVAVIYGWR